MTRRRTLGLLLVLAGVATFVLICPRIAWMVDGGMREYLQFGGLLLASLAMMFGLWLSCSAAARARPS